MTTPAHAQLLAAASEMRAALDAQRLQHPRTHSRFARAAVDAWDAARAAFEAGGEQAVSGKNAHTEAQKGPYDLTPVSLERLAGLVKHDGNYNETRLADTLDALADMLASRDEARDAQAGGAALHPLAHEVLAVLRDRQSTSHEDFDRTYTAWLEAGFPIEAQASPQAGGAALHPLALAYLEAFSALWHAKGDHLDSGKQHKAEVAVNKWSEAGCPLYAEAAPPSPREEPAAVAALPKFWADRSPEDKKLYRMAMQDAVSLVLSFAWEFGNETVWPIADALRSRANAQAPEPPSPSCALCFGPAHAGPCPTAARPVASHPFAPFIEHSSTCCVCGGLESAHESVPEEPPPARTSPGTLGVGREEFDVLVRWVKALVQGEGTHWHAQMDGDLAAAREPHAPGPRADGQDAAPAGGEGEP